jgi:hypothetical protein
MKDLGTDIKPKNNSPEEIRTEVLKKQTATAETIQKAKTLLQSLAVSSDEKLNTFIKLLSEAKEKKLDLTLATKEHSLDFKSSLAEIAMDVFIKDSNSKFVHTDNLLKAIEALLSLFPQCINYINPSNNTPLLHQLLSYPILGDHRQYQAINKVLELFFKYEADFNVKDSARTVIHVLILKQKVPAINAILPSLVKLGCGINRLYQQQKTALDLMSEKKGNCDIVAEYGGLPTREHSARGARLAELRMDKKEEGDQKLIEDGLSAVIEFGTAIGLNSRNSTQEIKGKPGNENWNRMLLFQEHMLSLNRLFIFELTTYTFTLSDEKELTGLDIPVKFDPNYFSEQGLNLAFSTVANRYSKDPEKNNRLTIAVLRRYIDYGLDVSITNKEEQTIFDILIKQHRLHLILKDPTIRDALQSNERIPKEKLRTFLEHDIGKNNELARQEAELEQAKAIEEGKRILVSKKALRERMQSVKSIPPEKKASNNVLNFLLVADTQAKLDAIVKKTMFDNNRKIVTLDGWENIKTQLQAKGNLEHCIKYVEQQIGSKTETISLLTLTTGS